MREFTSSSGSKLNGKILSATDSDVTLQLDNGREVTGGIVFFSKPDQEYIREWVEKNPVQISYDFEVDLSRERTDKRKATEGNVLALYETWRYKLNVENRSKSGTSGTSVDGLEIHYNLIKTPKSKAREGNQQNRSLSPQGATLTKKGKIDLGKMEYLKEREVLTDTIPINHSELAPGWYYTDGSKDEANDEFDGIIVRIVKDGKTVFETTHGSSQVEKVKFLSPQGSSSGEE